MTGEPADATECRTCGRSVAIVTITPIGLDAARRGLQPVRVIEAHGACPAMALSTGKPR